MNADSRGATESLLLSSADTAALLGVRPATLRTWRMRGLGPAFFRYTPNGQARYRRTDVLRWLDDNRRTPTASPTARTTSHASPTTTAADR